MGRAAKSHAHPRPRQWPLVRNGALPELIFAPFWLSLLGKSGTGKSHCAQALWRLHQRLDWTRTKYTPRFILWPAFVAELKQRLHDNVGLEIIMDMTRWPLLVLDDVMAEKDNNGFSLDQLNTILSSRIGKWTIITSNLTLKQISVADDRIASRMIREAGNQVMEMTTKNWGLRNLRPGGN